MSRRPRRKLLLLARKLRQGLHLPQAREKPMSTTPERDPMLRLVETQVAVATQTILASIDQAREEMERMMGLQGMQLLMAPEQKVTLREAQFNLDLATQRVMGSLLKVALNPEK
jgi:hypothetical protein